MPNGKGTSRAKRNALAPCGYCEVCGYDRATTKHRIVARRKGGEYVEGNVIELCRNCHWEADQMGLIPAWILQAIVDRRITLYGSEPPTKFEDHRLARIARCFAAKRGNASQAPRCEGEGCPAHEPAGCAAGHVAA